MAKMIAKDAPLVVHDIHAASNGNMVVTYLKGLGDVQPLITTLKEGQSVIFDLRAVPKATAQRMLDLISGATYALGGTLQRIQGALFVATQSGVGVKVNE